MKNIKTFEQFDLNGLLQPDFEKYLPKKIKIIKQISGEIVERQFNIGNIMRNSNMTQIIYTASEPLFGHPDEMSIDIYYYQTHKIKLTIDVIYGDLMSSEFTLIPPSEVQVIQYTSYHSQFDPSNTVFAFSDKTIQDFCLFFNKIDGFRLTPENFKFLNRRDDFNPTAKK